MKKLVVLLLPFFVTTLVYGQGSRQQPANIKRLQSWAQEPRVLLDRRDIDVSGTPYFNEDWETGYVQVNKKSKSNAVKLKYSSYTNEVLFQENGKVLALPSDGLTGFTIIDNSTEIEFKNGFSSAKYHIGKEQLMRVIYDGDTKLLAKEYTNLHKDEDPFTKEVEYDFFNETDFFLVSSDGTFHKIKLKEKDILNALGNHKNELKEFADSHNLDFGNEYHASLILKEYDKLSSQRK